MSTVISVEHLSKSYRLGAIGGGTLREDVARWWFRLRQRPDPGAINGQEHHARKMGQEFWALQDVNFTVQEGEILGVIGRNGAGKSTLLKILSRVTGPTAGHVRIKGRIASLLEVGTGFHPELTGRENIFLNGTILGMTKAEIRGKFDEIVDFSEIEEFIDTPVKRYSSGMYVRLAFAVAAHLEPEILIVDEVLAVGDAQFQKKCLGKLETVAGRQGRTVLFVSHNITAVRRLCKKVVYLKDGEVAFDGSMAQGVGRYLEAIGFGENDCCPVLESPDQPQFPLWLRRASLCSRGGTVASVPLNESLSLEIEFASCRPTRRVTFGLVFYGSEGHALLNLNNVYQPCAPLPVPVTSGRLTCDLGIVPLMPGRYTISLWVGESESDLQFFEHALTFEVTERDAWGTGRMPPANISPLWWPARFTLEPLASSVGSPAA